MEVSPRLPYPYTLQPNRLDSRFTTAKGVVYEAALVPAGHYFPNYDFAADAVELSLYSLVEPDMPTGLDARIGLTVINIITDYFQQNPRVVVCYVCDQADARAFKRAMRFARLFEQGNAGQQLEKADVEVPPLYASILFRRDHPARPEIERAVQELVGKFSDEEE